MTETTDKSSPAWFAARTSHIQTATCWKVPIVQIQFTHMASADQVLAVNGIPGVFSNGYVLAFEVPATLWRTLKQFKLTVGGNTFDFPYDAVWEFWEPD